MVRPLFRRAALPLVLIPTAGWASEGRVPIPFTSSVATPILIAAPGQYVVTRNLLPTAGGPLIDITVAAPSDVQIDLNGMVLNNSANPGSPVIQVNAVGGGEVTIRNGTLIGGLNGIQVGAGAARKVVIYADNLVPPSLGLF